MGIHDPTLQRVSACPVHFLWDGRGNGRLWVRLGFLGLLATAMFFVGAQMTRSHAFETAAIGTAAASSVVYLLGQALTLLAVRSTRLNTRAP